MFAAVDKTFSNAPILNLRMMFSPSLSRLLDHLGRMLEQVLWRLLTSEGSAALHSTGCRHCRHALRSPGISAIRSFTPHLLDLHTARIGNHGFCYGEPAHPPLHALYRVSVRQVVVVAPASFRPLFAETPLPSHRGRYSLHRRGLSPPRTVACPAYSPDPFSQKQEKGS